MTLDRTLGTRLNWSLSLGQCQTTLTLTLYSSICYNRCIECSAFTRVLNTWVKIQYINWYLFIFERQSGFCCCSQQGLSDEYSTNKTVKYQQKANRFYHKDEGCKGSREERPQSVETASPTFILTREYGHAPANADSEKQCMFAPTQFSPDLPTPAQNSFAWLQTYQYVHFAPMGTSCLSLNKE